MKKTTAKVQQKLTQPSERKIRELNEPKKSNMDLRIILRRIPKEIVSAVIHG